MPFADVGPLRIDSDLSDEQVLFLSDIFPTGYMAAEYAGIEPGDTVAIWGCGPVCQFAIQVVWSIPYHPVISGWNRHPKSKYTSPAHLAFNSKVSTQQLREPAAHA